ncbi:hypothetical protein NUU61_008823 [Penicillium alfredii]|uniref:Magnesium transporter NIPA n=1 Tax=Penicillium alfredii TaxID=1506179 RepID=A0A9W9EM47_9EURO|nr:uncharacterized protein NUU61_008823 [Penicillium alfredii]KAJ5084244.1 hypothetical protein NUU61_008823 [Penicillium alfredii]
MDSHSLSHASTLLARAEDSSNGRPPVYKAIGISLAVASGVFIGISFVIKKIGLLKANVKYNEEAGEGYGYLKNFWWWTGMTLMIMGEICNFVAYAFVDAILVTPLGALSVVITTILSAIFLKERLSFVGKVGCFCCIIGSVVIAMNAPEQSSVSDIQDMQHFVIAPGFLSYAGVIIVGSVITALWAGPRWGKKNMFVYISICSMIGGLSVVATQGLGAAILAQINGKSQFKEWFLYVLFVFVIATLLTEIIYLNKALNIFNAALVTPTYYVFFTSATIVTSAILFRGFKGSAVQITTVILGFLQICAGVVLLQLSKSSKDVPDAAVFKGDLDQVREVATQEEPESEPKADSIRGAAAIIRRISTARRTTEAEEARRVFHDRHEDQLKPPSENEVFEWDGLRRRRSTISRPYTPRTPSIKQQLPPLGMSRLPEPYSEDEEDHRPNTTQSGHSFLDGIRYRASSVLHPTQWRPLHEQDEKTYPSDGAVDTEYHGAGGTLNPGRQRSDTPRSVSWVDEKPPAHTPRRQFSFNSMFQHLRAGGILRRKHRLPGTDPLKSATEEEQLGLVQGGSRTAQPEEETLNERLERWSSSDSDLSDAQPMYTNRNHGASVSTMSTTAFPAYEDHQAFFLSHDAESNPYYLPPLGQALSPGPIEDDGRQLPSAKPRSRTRTDSSHGHAPPPAQSSFSTHRHPNPLPPLPDETSLSAEPAGMRSVSSASSDLGVESLSSSMESDSADAPTVYPARRQSGWRRHMSEASSTDAETYQQRGQGQGRGGSGAFV